jgi:hypothetical protein
VATIDGIRRSTASTAASARTRSSATDTEAATAVEDSRALVVVRPAPRIVPPTIGSNRVAAAFLAHLIAVDQQAPQTLLMSVIDQVCSRVS